jgi:hypothetical protein
MRLTERPAAAPHAQTHEPAGNVPDPRLASASNDFCRYVAVMCQASFKAQATDAHDREDAVSMDAAWPASPTPPPVGHVRADRLAILIVLLIMPENRAGAAIERGRP